MATEQTTSATTPRKGLNSGVCNELAAFFTVRPGRLQQLKEELSKRFPTAQNPVGMYRGNSFMKVGNHHVKHYLFDNDTRLALILTFDQSFDKYFDDFLTVAGPATFLFVAAALQEIPEGLDKMTFAQIKDAISGAQTRRSTTSKSFRT